MTRDTENEEPRGTTGVPRSPVHRRVVWMAWITLLLVALAVAWAVAWAVFVNGRKPATETGRVALPARAISTNDAPALKLAAEPEATHEQVMQLCASCHAYPPPDIFAKQDWAHEVTRGFNFFNQAQMKIDGPVPSVMSVVEYYEKRAPQALPVLEPPAESAPFDVRFERKGFRDESAQTAPGIANVRFLHLSDPVKFDVVTCDMLNSKVSRLKPYEADAKLEVLSTAIPHPAHSEVTDLDGDGVKDLLIANLGNPLPTDQRLGSVVWLRGSADGTYTAVTLADELGRVADAQAADFDGDGDLDIVVAAFGRLSVGEVLYFENRTTNWADPVFVRKVIDPRHGAIHVPVADLNGDGRPDFVAIISQEHETVVAYLNTGPGTFDRQVIYAAPHPAFGSSGIELVDLDKDGDLDVLMTNGDVLDSSLLRPYHGIRWLENRGSYPFVEHPLTSLYGVLRAVAADFDGDGDLDIAAVTFLPGAYYQPLRERLKLDAMIILEQTTPGTFVRHSLETVSCDHATLDAADYDGDGKPDFVFGNFFGQVESKSAAPWVVVGRNLGKSEEKP